MHIQFHFSNLLALFVVLAVVVFFVLFSVVTSVCYALGRLLPSLL